MGWQKIERSYESPLVAVPFPLRLVGAVGTPLGALAFCRGQASSRIRLVPRRLPAADMFDCAI